MLRAWTALCAAVLIACSAIEAQAIPVFAHRYGFSCQQCHTPVPHLNPFGESFRKSGFIANQRQTGAFPIAVKINTIYSSAATSEHLPKAIVDEVELLSGGQWRQRYSYFLEQYLVDGGKAGHTRDMWLQYNAAPTQSANSFRVRGGQFTLPLPADASQKLLAGAAAPAEVRDWILVCLAGGAIDALARGDEILCGPAADIDEAYDLAEQETGCREELEGLIQGLWSRAVALVDQPAARGAVERLAALLERGQLSAAEVSWILEQSMPRPPALPGPAAEPDLRV